MKQALRHWQTPRLLRGVTLTELIVVLAIITLLGTLAVPTVISRSEQARVATAKAETEALANAEQAVGLIHGFYVPLQLLDNVPNGSIATGIQPDDLDNELATILLVDISRSLEDQEVDQPELSDGILGLNRRVEELVENWAGPFVQPQRVFMDDEDLGNPVTVRRDYPLDPWGRPYFLYSPFGVVGTGARSVAAGSDPPDDNDLTQANFSDGDLGSPDADSFDRWAVVSFGPDGVSGRQDADVDDFEDDIIYFFDGPTSTTAVF